MSYNGSMLSGELTQLLPSGITLRISAWYLLKNYRSQGIYQDEESYADTILRKDRYSSGAMSLRKNINTSLGDLSLGINYQYIHNLSLIHI